MAGKKGRSGGTRAGAGYKVGTVKLEKRQDPLEFLLDVMNNDAVDIGQRVRAAVAAAQYKHVKLSDGGKKDEKGRAAEAASKGRFAPAAPPKLVVSNGGGQ
jgi:hypothetical protein